ncbi:MAG: hypothetical protein KDA96_13980 [Planctomycetaceae bacterium]|nr:hypothetical protein [Planctomycetaceae bacterium]
MLRQFVRTLISQLSLMRGDSDGLARRRFELHQDQLQKEFLTIAASAGIPRGLRWVACDWPSETDVPCFVREATSGLLTLLVPVNVRFEAIEDGDMEGVEAVGSVRGGTAVFHYQNGRWGSGGRVIFNLAPADVVARMADTFATIDQPG